MNPFSSITSCKISVWNTIFLISPVFYLRGRCTLISMETNGHGFSSTGLWVLGGQVKLGVNWLCYTCHHVIRWNLFKDDVEIECRQRHVQTDLSFQHRYTCFSTFLREDSCIHTHEFLHNIHCVAGWWICQDRMLQSEPRLWRWDPGIYSSEQQDIAWWIFGSAVESRLVTVWVQTSHLQGTPSSLLPL